MNSLIVILIFWYLSMNILYEWNLFFDLVLPSLYLLIIYASLVRFIFGSNLLPSFLTSILIIISEFGKFILRILFILCCFRTFELYQIHYFKVRLSMFYRCVGSEIRAMLPLIPENFQDVKFVDLYWIGSPHMIFLYSPISF